MLKEVAWGFVDLLFPPTCLICASLGEPFCPTCRAAIQPVALPSPPAGVSARRCAGRHEGPLRDAVLALKFQRKTALAAPLAGLLAAELEAARASWRPDALVPVPLHWTRRLERGFNQSELLAEATGRAAGLPVTSALRRVRRTSPQVGLPAADRRSNLVGAFAVSSAGRAGAVRGRRLVLVDDVTTTGSTLAECATELRRAGAAAVFAVTVSDGA